MNEIQSSTGFIAELTGQELPSGGKPVPNAAVHLYIEIDSDTKVPNMQSVWNGDAVAGEEGQFDVYSYATPVSQKTVGLEVTAPGYKTVYTTYVDYSDPDTQTFLVVMVPEKK